MKSPVIKRSIVIAGHKTSVSLEDAFWKGLKEIADDRNVTLSDLVFIHRHRSPARQSLVGDPAVRARPLSQPHHSGARARGDARPDRDAGGDLSSARRVGLAAADLPAARSRRPAPRLSARGAARGFGAAGIVIGGGSAGAWAPSEIPSVALGAGTAGALSGTTDRAPGSAGFGSAAPAAAADSRAAFSIASSCLDCCSSSRNVSQLVSRVVSTVRLGAGSAPLSATIKAGGAAPGGLRRRIKREQRIEHGVAEIDVDGGLQIGAVGPHDDVAQARLPRVDADRGGGLRHRQAGIVERAGDEFPNAIAAGRNAKLDGAGHRVEHVGIEPDQPAPVRA